MIQSARLRPTLLPDPVEGVEDAEVELLDGFCDKAYVVEATGARATMQSATSLINKYCQQLPSDRYVFKPKPPPISCIFPYLTW